tara:strand:+ start:50 stop:196 length:147 start_codon:yes stop_codon:yes gene_type:complete
MNAGAAGIMKNIPFRIRFDSVKLGGKNIPLTDMKAKANENAIIAIIRC